MRNKALRYSIYSITLLLFSFLLSYFRVPLLGISPGYAPHNFSFNVGVYGPMQFVSMVLSVISIFIANSPKSVKVLFSAIFC